MKNTIYSKAKSASRYFMLVTYMFAVVSCDTPYTVWSNKTFFSIFRFQDPSYMEYAFVDSIKNTETGQYTLELPFTARRGTERFFLSTEQMLQNSNISPCEIADEESIYYPLHDGYYMCFPLRGMAHGQYLSTCKWKDLCVVNMDTVHVMLPIAEVFANIHVISGIDVGGYCNKNVDRLTLDDVARYVNMLIDQHENNPSAWRESSEIVEYY